MSAREDFEDLMRRHAPTLSLSRDKHDGKWSDYYNVSGTHVAWVMFKALERISRPHDCGCWPCTGSCMGEQALQITTEEMRDTAAQAIADVMTEKLVRS
jgi:hypothetical protein